jgi:hypothetical protein
MKKQILNFIKYSFALAALVLMVGAAFGFIDVAALGHGIGLAFAAAAGDVVQEPVTTANDNPDVLKETIAKNITRMHPDKYPFDTILREMGVIVPSPSWKTSYFEVDTRPLEDSVKTAVLASGTTSAAWATFDIEVNALFMWNVDDNVLVQGINGNDSKDLVLHVVAITTTALTVIAINGLGANSADLPDIAAGTKLTRIGNSKEETAAQTTPFAVLPNKNFNYNQIHMAQVEQSLYDKLHEKYVNWDLNEFRSEALWDMRGQMELTSLFGVRNYAYDPIAKKYKYFSGGAVRYITNVISKAATGFDNDSFVDIAKTVFNDNNGSETRVIFAGSGARATMSKSPSVMKQMTQRDVEVVWGVKFNRIETDFGTFLVKHHPLLNKVGWTNNAFILDMSNIEKHVFKAMETNSIDFNASGQRKTNADIIDEAFCTVYKNPNTHNILKLT